MYSDGIYVSATNNVPPETVASATFLLEEVRDTIDNIGRATGIRRAIIRPRLNTSVYILLDKSIIHIIVQVLSGSGIPLVVWWQDDKVDITLYQASDSARYDIGFNEPFGFSLPKSLLGRR